MKQLRIGPVLACVVAGVLLIAAPGTGGRLQAQSALEVSGVIEAHEITIASELAGRVRAVQVAEGDAVTPDSVLVVLDDAPCRANLAQAQATVRAAEADLALAKAGPRPAEVAAAEALVGEARATLEGARQAWQDAVAARERPQELALKLAAARAQVAGAEHSLDAARADVEMAAQERDRLSYNSRQWQAAEFVRQANLHAVTAAEKDLEAARAYLAGLEAIHETPLELLAAEHQAAGAAEVAEAALAVAEARLAEVQAGPSPEEVAVAEAQLRLAEAQAAALQHQCERHTLRAPAEGTVLAQLVRAGEAVLPGTPLLRLADLRRVELVLYVPEPRIGEVTLGQSVEVRVDSFRGRTFTGHVTRIADRAEFTPRNVATHEERVNTYYAVRVSLPNPEGALKPGMPADAVLG